MQEKATYVLVGVLVGAVLMTAIFFVAPSVFPADDGTISASIVDMLIEEWTNPSLNPSFAEGDGKILSGIPAKLELPDARPHFIPDTVRALARTVELTYHIPYGVTIAQWVLESKWGQANLGASNYFGLHFEAVKDLMETPSWVWRRDLIVVNGEILRGDSVRFANFKNIGECFSVRARYLQRANRYHKAFETQKPERFARELAKGGYATDPDYSMKLITIMRRYKLE